MLLELCLLSVKYYYLSYDGTRRYQGERVRANKTDLYHFIEQQKMQLLFIVLLDVRSICTRVNKPLHVFYVTAAVLKTTQAVVSHHRHHPGNTEDTEPCAGSSRGSEGCKSSYSHTVNCQGLFCAEPSVALATLPARV